jgi:hypothetical protein
VLSNALLLAAGLLVTREGTRRAARDAVANALAGMAVLVLPRMVVAGPILALLAMHARPEGSKVRTAMRFLPASAFALVMVRIGALQLDRLGGVPSRTPTEVLLDVAAVLATQVGHLLWPVDLLAYYFRVPGDPSVAAMLGSAALVTAGLVAVVARTEPRSPIRTGAMIALVAYAPVSCVFAIRRWTSDSYMYLPLIGLAFAVVPAVARHWPARLERVGHHAKHALFAVLGLLSFAQSTRWSSSTAVWDGLTARYPNLAHPLSLEAMGRLADGRLAEADQRFIELDQRFPEWDDTLEDSVRAYLRAGDGERAWATLGRCVRVGKPECVHMLWQAVIAGSARRLEPDVARVAFERGRDELFATLHDRDALDVIARALRGAKLEAEAVAVEARARAIPRRDPP